MNPADRVLARERAARLAAETTCAASLGALRAAAAELARLRALLVALLLGGRRHVVCTEHPRTQSVRHVEIER